MVEAELVDASQPSPLQPCRMTSPQASGQGRFVVQAVAREWEGEAPGYMSEGSIQ